MGERIAKAGPGGVAYLRLRRAASGFRHWLFRSPGRRRKGQHRCECGAGRMKLKEQYNGDGVLIFTYHECTKCRRWHL